MIAALAHADMLEYFGTAILPSMISRSDSLPRFGPDASECPTPLPAGRANTIYVCDCQNGSDASCVAGDDNAAGTATAPQRSLSAVKTAFALGNDVALCRGGAWSGGEIKLYVGAARCSAVDPCTVADYGSTALPKPLLENNLGDGDSGIVLDPGNNTFFDGFAFSNLHVKKRQPDSTGSSVGIFIFRNLNDVTLRCMEVEGFSTGVYTHPNGTSTHNVRIADSYIHDNTYQGMLGGTSDFTVERNRFVNNGYVGANALYHNLYVGVSSSLDQTASNITVRRNYLSASAVDGNGSCQGVNLNMHGGIINDALVESNYIEETNAAPGCWGIAVDGASSAADTNNRAVIRGNVVRNVGNVGIGVSSCIDCIIENNIVIQEQLAWSRAIAAPNRSTTPPRADNNATTLRNNTVWFGSNVTGEGYYVGERGSGYKVSNNIAYFTTFNASGSGFHYDLAASSYDLISHNLCFGAAFDSGTTGMDAQPYSADPKFVNAPYSFKLRSDSPARNGGSPLSSSLNDIRNRTRDIQPDLGAYEY